MPLPAPGTPTTVMLTKRWAICSIVVVKLVEGRLESDHWVSCCRFFWSAIAFLLLC